MRPFAAALLAGLIAGPALAQTPTPPPAKPHRHHRHHHHAPATVAANPPPPAAPAEPGSPAPVPDESKGPPVNTAPQRTDFSPALMGIHYPPVGEGYVQGSSPQAMDDKNVAKAPGLQVTVPIASGAPAPLPPVNDPRP